MNRTFSDQPSTRSYEESSVSAKGPSATTYLDTREQLGSTLREHLSPSPDAVPLESTSQTQNDVLSVVDHRGAPSDRDTHSPYGHDLKSAPKERHDEEAAAETSSMRPISPTGASMETAGSPIMKMQPPSVTTPSLRNFPVNAEHNLSLESVHAPVRQRTDSRPTISPTETSRAVSTPPPMPLPEALQDARATVRRAQGQRAESELVHSRNSTKPFNFPSRSSAQFASQERSEMLRTKTPQTKNGGSFIRRLIRRASLSRNKSQSVGGSPSWVLSPSRTSIALPTELGIEGASDAPTKARSESVSSKGTAKDSKPRTSLTRRRSKSRDAGSSKASRTSSIFAPFLARDPSKIGGRTRSQRNDSFGHLGPLPLDDPPPFPRDGLPLSSSTPFLAHDPDFAGDSRVNGNGVKSRDFASHYHSHQTEQSSLRQQDDAEILDSPQMVQTVNRDASGEPDQEPRPLSYMTNQTDNSLGMGLALTNRSNGFNFQDSLGLNELSAAPKQRSTTVDSEPNSFSLSQSSASSAGHRSATQGHARPRAGIPRIWQGLEPVDGDNAMRSTHIDDVDDSDDSLSVDNVPANRFDSVTTNSSFRTAVTHFDSPKSAAGRRQNIGSRASRMSLRTLDTPLARHFDQASRQDSPLADLISNLESRLSIPSMSGAMGSAPYHNAAASPSSEFLHREIDEARPAMAVASSVLPSSDGHATRESYNDFHEDDDASTHALPLESHLPAASHTALVETISHSKRNSSVDPALPASQAADETMDGTQRRYNKRDTFGGLESVSVASDGPQEEELTSGAVRPQLSRFSTATNGPGEEDQRMTRPDEGEVEHQEMVLPEVKVSDIESHLAAVEAALQDNRKEGSFDPTSLRQRMSDASYLAHANTSSASMLSREGSQQPFQNALDESKDSLSLPGAWAQDSSSFIMSDDGRRITLAPESHEALADAVRSVRRAISSSQLSDADESGTALASRSMDTLGMESFMSDAADTATGRVPAGDISVLSEATPARAAKRRQEGMRDIEEAYGRMLALVQSSAIGVTPSPQIRGEEGRLGLEPPRRPQKSDMSILGDGESFSSSPLFKASTKTDEPLRQQILPKPGMVERAGMSQSGQSGQSKAGEHRTSASLSGLMGMPLNIDPQMLRQASVSSSSSAVDVSRNESLDGVAMQRRPPSAAKSTSSRYSQAFSREHAHLSVLHIDGYRKRFSTDNTTVGRASSGGGHTSPSATAKTLGTPRSFATSVSQHSLANMVRRHELEKESLLDSLERVRAENADLHARHDSLTSDLHAEVTRVLELERELERRDSREVTLIGQIQDLENELVELRYLDHQLNSTADQTLESEDGEGSIMDVELPPSLNSSVRMGTRPFSPRVMADQMSSPPPSFSSIQALASTKPTHKSTRSEAFVSILPGSERSTLPTSRSELPRARPVSLLNGPGGLFREDNGSERSKQASPLTTPRSSSLLRVRRASIKGAKPQQISPTLLGLSLPKEDNESWNIADEQLPEGDDGLRSHQRAPSVPMHDEASGTRLSDGHGRAHEHEEDRNSSAPSTVQHRTATNLSSSGETPQRQLSSSSSSSFIPRSTSQATVTKNGATQLPRASPAASKIPTSRSVSGTSESPSHRSVSSRLPRFGLKPSTRYHTTSGNGMRTVSGATDKSTASTLSSVYSNISAGAPPSLGSLPSGNNTMEKEIEAELARLGNPQPYMRYYSPPRSKMI